MPGPLLTILSLSLVMMSLMPTEVISKRSCSYACMKDLFSCKRRNEEECCNKFADCFLSCDLPIPPCAEKRGSWNKRYHVNRGYELYPYY